MKTYFLIPVFFVLLTSAIYARPIHTHSTGRDLAFGVEYRQTRRITSAGTIDVHVITVDLNQNGLTLGPALPPHGSRDTTTNLLNNSGAVGGINADFFELNIYPSTSAGQIIQNGRLREINAAGSNWFTFLTDINNTPFIEVLRPEINFITEGIWSFRIFSINKLGGNINSALFEHGIIRSTEFLDNRQENLVKIVVENDIITHISYPGEIVYMPDNENAYIIVLTYHYFNYFRNHLHVNNSAELYIRANIDINNIWHAISGGASIVRNGAAYTSGYVVAPGARHPRSAVGISQDRATVFLVAIDGRGISIGVAQNELANIMLELGAYTAMHMDGGGSTAMGIRPPGENMRLANTVSDGSQRRVVNALGVFNNAPAWELTGVTVRTFPAQVFAGDGINVYTLGLDAHLNTFTLNPEGVRLTTVPMVNWDGHAALPTAPGVLNFNLNYREFSAQHSVNVLSLAQINPSVGNRLEMNTGEQVELNFTGTSNLGQRAFLNRVNVELMPATVGSFQNGIFTGGTTSGVIRASLGSIVAYISVDINETGPVIPPGSSIALNPYRRDLSEPGVGFDITVAGNISLENFLEDTALGDYLQIRNSALTRFRQNSHLGIFAGPTEVEEVENLDTMPFHQGYRYRQISDTAFINISARRGSLTGTSPYNWSFVNEVAFNNPRHVIIFMDRPLESLPHREQEMLVHALEEMFNQGRDVFLVMSSGEINGATIQNGVNYINLANLFIGEEVNNQFMILRFRVEHGQIFFDLHRAF